ncbi:UrcA family protein [Sphingomonas sp. 2378]|uniref:UrcA family protein n=1 Tax=Sphingomonas sp. 2378 TaxID=1219748 RepID=UPI00311AF5CD
MQELKPMKNLCAVALAALVFAPSVQAAERQTVSAAIPHADLDLRRADHRTMLDARIRHATTLACGPMTTDLIINADVARCRKEMRADAAIKVAALTTQAPVALASNQ